ncbi:LPD7 domain-containing protein, partial [Janthinobacterium sp. FW305-128]|uniref:LPD7 domain-containing protein n=1 Tax=Janthinobacterium sp. FW305-128 TaxID=2775055 RepID=UPI001E573CA3
AVPPPLPGAVAEAAPLQAASMEMPPPLPGAAVPPPLPGAVAEAAPLQAASMQMPPPLPSAAEAEATSVEREPNSVGYWRRNTIDALTMQLTGYLPEVSDPDQMEQWDKLHKELKEAKTVQAEVEKRYDRIYGQYLAVPEASSDPSTQANALTSQQHGDDVPTWMNDIPPLDDFYEMTGADIEHGQAMAPPTVAPEQTLEVPAVPVAAEQGLEIAERARQERLARAALEQVAQTRASENAAVREELGMNRIEPMTLAKKDLPSEASRWANRAPSADAEVNSKVAQQGAERERAIPAEVEKKYIRVGEKFYHGNNHKVVAFEDKGTQLSTKSDSQAIASSLVAIAQARGWQEIKISGSEAFKKQVWMEASLLGIEAKGYKPTAVEIADLQKRLPENKIEEFRVREKDRMAEAGLPAAASPLKDAATAKVDAQPPQRTHKEELSAAALQSNHKETQFLSAHGAAPYKHNPDEKESYFVETENKSGQKKTHWGKDLKRAISESGAKIGDEIHVDRVGAKDVVVTANIKDGSGKKVGEEKIETKKNEWVVSVTQALKTQDIGDAVKQHPELSGSAAVLKAVELQTANNTPEQKKIIMDRVKENLANSIERGNIPQVKIRENVSEIKTAKQQAGKEQEVELQKELEL